MGVAQGTTRFIVKTLGHAMEPTGAEGAQLLTG